MRASLDLDYSLAREADSDAELGRRLEKALRDHLGRHGLTVFDWSFRARPKTPSEEQSRLWGGYHAEFKVIEAELWTRLDGDLERARNRAWGITSGGGAPRRFRIELSRNEMCLGAGQKPVCEGHSVRVYTPAMIAIEKLRSLCQQMPEYSPKRRPRGRDFYDIHAVVTEASVNLVSPTNLELIRVIFAAKDVPLELLGLIEGDLVFHEDEWVAVRDSIPAEKPTDFEFYTDFVVEIVRRLEPLWIEDAP